MSQRKSNPNCYPPSISLRDLAERLTVPVVRIIVEALPDMVESQPKGKELWRYIHAEAVCMAIGYSGSVVVSGEDAEAMRALAHDIRQAASLNPVSAARALTAAESAIAFIDANIAMHTSEPLDYDALHDLGAAWGALEPVYEALAYEHIASSIADPTVRRSYLRLTEVLVNAFDLGMSAAFDYMDEKTGMLDPLPPVPLPETYPTVARRAVRAA